MDELDITTELNQPLLSLLTPGRPKKYVQFVENEEIVGASVDQTHSNHGLLRETGAKLTVEVIHSSNKQSASDIQFIGSESDSDETTDSEDYSYEINKLSQISIVNSRPTPYDGSGGRLQKQLHDIVLSTRLAAEVPEKAGFVPRQQLLTIMNEVSVAKELSKIERSFRKRLQFWRSISSPNTIQRKAEIICARHSLEMTLTDNRELVIKSFRKVFAILLLIERPGTIGRFIDEEVYDVDLPLRKVPRKKNSKAFSLCRRDGSDSSLKCFEGWNRATLERFERSQWRVMAPFFSGGEKKKVKHYTLEPDEILPFTYRECASTGAHGEVFKMARQCEGIAEGLNRIHHHETTSRSSIFVSNSTAIRRPATPTNPGPGRIAREPRFVFGRHGDIKPTNLLWFPNPRDSKDKGTIKISDSGTGEFSAINFAPSKSSSVSHSPRYRPPECDLPDPAIDNSYDVWTLSCLYLEFITWFVLEVRV
ncbi:hypothetical protein G7Y89_g12242 [Cudoniella acicularis]|uniref:Protein kinase domain-containing protein n=1 Tax=Cudoniella acicularis TaxID=354080 RepID=A0A8H4RAU0_9HELO|nr:hypothetical protein G7Y89_g12242 [Cudoniella acicularis]